MSEFRYGERLFLMIQNPHVIKKKKMNKTHKMNEHINIEKITMHTRNTVCNIKKHASGR